jgi:hypothetical protein
MAYGSSLISAVYFIDLHIAAIGVDFVWTCEAIALTSSVTTWMCLRTTGVFLTSVLLWHTARHTMFSNPNYTDMLVGVTTGQHLHTMPRDC